MGAENYELSFTNMLCVKTTKTVTDTDGEEHTKYTATYKQKYPDDREVEVVIKSNKPFPAVQGEYTDIKKKSDQQTLVMPD
jgi:Zn-dependent metalloprotease